MWRWSSSRQRDSLSGTEGITVMTVVMVWSFGGGMGDNHTDKEFKVCPVMAF
jgi:hypothetical protein